MDRFFTKEPGNMFPGHYFDPLTATMAIASVASAGVSIKSSIDSKKAAKKQRALQQAAYEKQVAAQDAEEAAQLRQQNKLDEQEADAQSALVSQRRAIVARRRGRGSTAYTPSTGLKSKLGE